MEVLIISLEINVNNYYSRVFKAMLLCFCIVIEKDTNIIILI